MEEDNLSRQADEVEALSSIYGEEWCVLDEANRAYCIQVTGNLLNSASSICLQVIFPVDYPGTSPPEYQLNAPWLRGHERALLDASLQDIYCQNIGESIIYLWVEKIREFLEETAEKEDCSENKTADLCSRTITRSEETDHNYDEDGFDSITMIAETNVITSVKDLPAEHAVECPTILHAEPVTDRKSTFQAHLAPVSCKQEVRLVVAELYKNKKIANATHNILAYRIWQSDRSTFLQGCDDDGETHAGSRMLHLLKIVDAKNVVVVVSRWYGGIHLGPDRFKHINNCTRNILEQHGYIMNKEDKKGPRSTKKVK